MHIKETDNQGIREELFSYIIEKIDEYKLSSYQLSKYSGISHVGIDKIMDGRTTKPSLKTLEKIKEGIQYHEKQQSSPVTLNSLNDKLDLILVQIENLNNRIGIFELDNQLLVEIIKNSSNPEELKAIESLLSKKS